VEPTVSMESWRGTCFNGLDDMVCPLHNSSPMQDTKYDQFVMRMNTSAPVDVR